MQCHWNTLEHSEWLSTGPGAVTVKESVERTLIKSASSVLGNLRTRIITKEIVQPCTWRLCLGGSCVGLSHRLFRWSGLKLASGWGLCPPPPSSPSPGDFSPSAISQKEQKANHWAIRICQTSEITKNKCIRCVKSWDACPQVGKHWRNQRWRLSILFKFFGEKKKSQFIVVTNWINLYIYQPFSQ